MDTFHAVKMTLIDDKRVTFINSFMTEVLLTYDIITSPLISSANQYTGFYMIETSIMKELTSKKFLLYHVMNRS